MFFYYLIEVFLVLEQNDQCQFINPGLIIRKMINLPYFGTKRFEIEIYPNDFMIFI